MPDMPGRWGEAQRDAWAAQREALGAFIRERRKQANLSLRQLAELTSLSNPYLSQVERGLHQPSVRVLKAISDALNLSAETLLAQAGLIDALAGGTAAEDQASAPDTEQAIRADQRLSEDQKSALIVVYRSMLGQPESAP
jgi:transcriptional regulator with XRE-family HTH domain